jgi:hypothetical protein
MDYRNKTRNINGKNNTGNNSTGKNTSNNIANLHIDDNLQKTFVFFGKFMKQKLN